MADIATLGLSVESGDVKQGAADLDRLTAAAKRAEQAVAGLASSKNAASATLAAAKASQTQAAASLAAAKASQTASQADRDAASAAYAKAKAATMAARADLEGVNASYALAKAQLNEANSALRAAQASRAANDNVHRMSGSMSGLAAQFQDIGVTAAAGMSPAIIGLQQGAQIAGQMEMAMQGGASAVGVLGNAFKSLFSPLTFIVIALTTLAAAGLQMVKWGDAGAEALNALAGVLQPIAPYAVAAAAALALLYAPAIIGGITVLSEAILGITARLAGLAIGFALANPAIAFVAGITAAVAAANIFRDELAQIFGRDIVADAKAAVNFVIGAFVGGFNAIKATWSALPSAIGDLVYKAADFTVKGVETMINAVIDKINTFVGAAYNAISGLAGKIGVNIGTFKGIGHVDLGGVANPYAGAASDAASAAKGAFGSAMDTDYVAKGVDGIGHAASTAAAKVKELAGWVAKLDDPKAKKKKHGGKTDAEKYDDILTDAKTRLATLKAERDAVGLSDLAAAKLKYETQELNAAQQKGIHLTAQQRAELIGLADQMAETEVATKKAKEALDFAKDATKGFLSDLRQGLANGEGFWKSFGNAAMNVLDKIVDKLEGEFVDALFSASQAGSGVGGGGFLSTLLGGIGSLLGFASGGYTGNRSASSVAGVVHGGEYVFSKRATDRIGIGALDQLHSRAKGYAGGGYVQPETPRIYPAGNQNMQPLRIEVVGEEGPMFRPTIKAVSNGQAVKVVDQRAPAHVQQGIAKYDKNMPGRISEVMERHG